ncbi:MAG: hypothetical protein JO358_04485 [Alphaproteobacteria bacterium]|nr:hypothetical protein [Alphaproteobacteria bacterium]
MRKFNVQGRPVAILADDIIDRNGIAETSDCSDLISAGTPVTEVDAADYGPVAASLSFKLELLQHAGRFKSRRAFTNLLSREIPEARVVAASGGNHGWQLPMLP